MGNLVRVRSQNFQLQDNAISEYIAAGEGITIAIVITNGRFCYSKL